MIGRLLLSRPLWPAQKPLQATTSTCTRMLQATLRCASQLHRALRTLDTNDMSSEGV